MSALIIIGFTVVGILLYMFNENFKAHGKYNQETRDRVEKLERKIAALKNKR